MSLSILHFGIGIGLFILFLGIFTAIYYQQIQKKALIARLRAPDYYTALRVQRVGLSDYPAYIKVEDNAKRLLQEGVAAYHQGDYLKAIQNYEESIEQFKKLGNDFFLAENLVRIGMIQRDTDFLSPESSIIKRFPQPPYENPLIISFHHMLQALIAESEKNWGSADRSWRKALSFEGLDSEFQLICQEALLSSEVRSWLNNPLPSKKEDLLLRLERWQEECIDHKQYNSLCKVYLLRVRVELATFQFDKAEKWLNLCLKTAQETNLNHYIKIAQEEIEIYLQHKEQISHVDQEKQIQEYIKEALASLEKIERER